MQDFDALKKLWQEEPENARQISTPAELSSTSQRNRKWLKNTQLIGAIGQIFTGAFITWMIFYGNFGFKFWYTYLSMGLVVLLCLIQASFMFYTYGKIKAIDDSLSPAEHLRQWENYYAIRKKQLTFQGPVFTILLSIILGIYYIEILSGRPFLPSLIIVIATIAWILFAYFYLGRKSIKKETGRLQAIIDELKQVEKQFSTID
jgi:Na+/H+ antiporter NhaD/arsenite permease-like protein